MIQAVIDTNVIVSAFLTKHSDAATYKVLHAVLNGSILPLTSRKILKEYNDVLHRPKFHLSDGVIQRVLSAFVTYGCMVEPARTLIILPDPKDVPFWEIILSCPNAYLVTGNKKHFPQDAHVVSPAEMLDLLER